MRKIVVFTLVYSFLIKYAVGGNRTVTALGELLGPLGPTIIEKPHNATQDVESIYNGLYSDSYGHRIPPQNITFSKFLVNRTLAQRLAIRDVFQKRFDQGVVDNAVCGSLSNYNYDTKQNMGICDFYNGLFAPVAEYLADRIEESLSKAKDWNYMSIICTSSATKLKAINEAYQKRHDNKLLSDRINEQLNDKDGIRVMRRMLDPQLMRPDFGSDLSKVDEQISFIPNHKVSCKTKKLLEFMTAASFEQIRLVAIAYPQKPDNYNQAVVDRFRQHCPTGDMQEAYKRIVRYAVDPYGYLAEEFRLGEEGKEFHYNSNIIILISRCDVDLKDVLAAYNRAYGKDLLLEAKKIKKPNSAEEIYYAIIGGNTIKYDDDNTNYDYY